MSLNEKENKTNLSLASASLLNEEAFGLNSSRISCLTESSQNFDDILNPSDKSCSEPGLFDELSFRHRELISEKKVQEFKDLLNKVNDGFINYKTNEFILHTLKNRSTSWKQHIEAVTKFSGIQEKIQLRNKDGEVFNLLGLDEEDIKPSINRSLLSFSKSNFRDHAVEVLKAEVAKLKLQKKSLQDEFGPHGMKVMDGVMTREQKQQSELYSRLEELQNQAQQLLEENCSMTEQLAALRQQSDRDLEAAMFNLLQNQASYLQTLTSSLKERLDQALLIDEDTKKKMDSEGDNLKMQISQMKDELKTLQKTLVEYEKKEATSKEYKEIIEEYGKLKKQLDHKRQTLNMLNDPNASF